MTLTLEKREGPPCPRCGCEDSEIREQAGRWRIPSFRRRCRNCGFSWVEQGDWPQQQASPAPNLAPIAEPGGGNHSGVVTYPRLRCPRCGSVKVRCTSSPKAAPGEPRIRKHRCECGHAFQSVED